MEVNINVETLGSLRLGLRLGSLRLGSLRLGSLWLVLINN
jgi:hypothetical protein